PDYDTMRADIQTWLDRQSKMKDYNDEIDLQTDYVRDLLSATDYPDFDVDKVAALFKQWQDDKRKDILTYRDIPYPSVKTGQLAPIHHTRWLDEMDDSLEAYLRTESALKRPQQSVAAEQQTEQKIEQ